MNKQKIEKIEIIKYSRNNISDICRKNGYNVQALYHGKYRNEVYNQILKEIYNNNKVTNFIIKRHFFKEEKKNETSSKI